MYSHMLGTTRDSRLVSDLAGPLHSYCTGLLVACRVLKMLEMDQEYEGNVEATGEDFSVEPAQSRSLSVLSLMLALSGLLLEILSLALPRGALDGGIDIPDSDKRFAGFKKNGKQLDAEVHRKYIFGGHVASDMRVHHNCSIVCILLVTLLMHSDPYSAFSCCSEGT
ncbi:large ribosomal subunit protein uL18-like [Typha angustifolia]|uniref:large ribosomal subunit protein uL18-like n=1 Tax=Typha angustifolia TaxID=59011 RepID=UPI003C2B6874